MQKDADHPTQAAGGKHEHRGCKPPAEAVQMPTGGEPETGIYGKKRALNSLRERSYAAPECFGDAGIDGGIAELDVAATIDEKLKTGPAGLASITAVARVMGPATSIRQTDGANHRG